ncbi:MAG: DUF2298 domain-containing protein [Caldilineaceae bacterium]
MFWQFLSWYLVIQLITLAALPLTLRLFVNLPDRGYAFTKSLGILGVGFILWLGYSYGLLRNETGGAWLALLGLAAVSYGVGYRKLRAEGRQALPSLRYIGGVELIFLVAFVAWAIVRAYDPAVNHTEEPMDLMFMNSIWTSPTYPPHDAWLGGYAISYYYLGYWLLTTLGRLAGQPPEIAYTVGQASWYGLLWLGCFGMGYNLLAQRYRTRLAAADGLTQAVVQSRAVVGGLLSAVLVAVVGNLQALLEWLNANGVNISGLARWLDVNNFPANAPQTELWYISTDWWWWRPSRVISDHWLNGDHMEVIDEFPIFSYVLGDNHPHVMAMPFVLLVIALAYNLFLSYTRGVPPVAPEGEEDDGRNALLRSPRALGNLVRSLLPLGWGGAIILVVATGSLIFFNTWDFPPYWLLLVITIAILFWRKLGQLALSSPAVRWGQSAVAGILFAVALLLAILLLYLPYFLTAQSQASGIVPNLFNPTRLPQFFLMFGFALCSVPALVGIGWSGLRAERADSTIAEALTIPEPLRRLTIIAACVYGLPLFWLVLSVILANTPRGQVLLHISMPLPEDVTSYTPIVLQRWSAHFWTFLVLGALVTLLTWLVWQLIDRLYGQPETAADAGQEATLFVALLALIALLLVYAPEFVYLRDNFGTRMNTVFKFYYQAWLLFGLSTAYVAVVALVERPQLPNNLRLGTMSLAALSLVVALSGIIFPLAAVYSKTNGFSASPTFDATAYLTDSAAAELAAAAWVRANTAPDAVVLEGKGASYWSNYNRISTMTGRQTLLGWDGHEAQWRGQAFGIMAQGRADALAKIYHNTSPEEIARLLAAWSIDYVYVGPTERDQYGVTGETERALATAADLAFDQANVRIYQRRR